MQKRGKDIERGNKIMLEFCLGKFDSSPAFVGDTGVTLTHIMH